jgi:RNA polymerase sigma-70 factor (ECF subfamily)
MEDPLLTPAEQRLLAERVSAGDGCAEDELVRWFHPRIFAALVCRTGDRESSRDITHDVLIATLRTLREGALQEPEKLAQFVHGVARNLANGHIRTQSIRRPRETALGPELADRIAAPVTHASEEGEALEKSVQRALSTLESGDRDILLMTIQGRKPREIAQSLELSSETVRQRKCRAMQRLRDSVKKLSRIEPSRHLVRGERSE